MIPGLLRCQHPRILFSSDARAGLVRVPVQEGRRRLRTKARRDAHQRAFATSGRLTISAAG